MSREMAVARGLVEGALIFAAIALLVDWLL